MSIVGVFARFRRGSKPANTKAPSAGRRSAAGRALSSLAVVAVAVALAPGLRGQVARAESQAPRPRPVVMTGGGLNFSDPPRDGEFLRTGLFAQPLIPVGPKPTTLGENQDLAAALHAYLAGSRAHGADEVGPLVAFLDKHPQSPWRASLEVDVGAVYRRFGHFSKALPIWRAAWDETKGLRDPNGRAIGDAAAGYLSQIEAYLGRKETLAPLLDEIKKRPVRGSARELVENSAEGLASMIHRPEDSFRCGPMALARILQRYPSPDKAKGLQALGRAESTPNGLSLSAVQRQSVDAGMNYQMAFRSPGAPVIVPAVAHWKVGHFAAILVERPDDHYLVGDLTFGDDVVVSRATLDEEASGFFLVPPGPLPEGWRPVGPAEGDSVWGRGYTGNNHDLSATGSQETQAFPCAGRGGCTTWNVEASLVSLSLHDDPVGYQPPYGQPVRFNLWYSHRDSMQVTPFAYTNFGNKWTFEWLSYIAISGCDGEYGQAPMSITPQGGPMGQTQFPTCVSLYRRGGGAENYFFQNPLDTGTAQTSNMGEFSQGYLTALYPQSPDAGADGIPPSSFTRTLPDGTLETFGFALGTYNPPYTYPQYFLTDIEDPQGNHVSIGWDTQTTRITTITDAANNVTTICYDDSGAPCAAPGDDAPVCPPPPAAQTCNLMVTQIIDPFGRSASFGYGQDNHLTRITDTIGIESQFHYQLDSNNDPTDFVDTLTTPYGTTQFSFYGALDITPGDSPSGVDGDRAVKIVDPLNRTSMVEYIQGSTGALDCSGSNVLPSDGWSLTAEPNTHIPCADQPQTIPSSTGVPQSYWTDENLQYRNTFIWDAYQFAASCPINGLSTNTAGGLAPNGLCYPNAKIIHWLHTNQSDDVDPNSANPKTASRTPESIKGPTESRIWFAYPYQSSGVFASTLGVGSTNQPTIVGRVITNPIDKSHTSQVWQYTYNANGNVTQIVDPAGRTFQMNYAANNIDLVNVINKSNGLNDLLLTIAPNAQHLPISVTPANGQPTTFTYNNAGQVLTKTEPLPGGTWTYCYQPNNCSSMTPGFLQSITGPGGAPGGKPQYLFTYDTDGRVGSTTDASGEYIQYWYDDADRLTEAKFPDATTIQLGYANPNGKVLLDLTSVTDRAGYITARTYDSDRELTSVQENAPNGRTTVLSYWPNKKLESIQDPNGNTTLVDIDLEGRTTDYHDVQTGQSRSYSYDDAGRVAQVWPTANNGDLRYWYNFDDTLETVEVDNLLGGPTISYLYDQNYKRLTSWSKAIGTNTVSSETYSYYPVAIPAALGANLPKEVTSTVNFVDAPNLSLTSTTEYQTAAGAAGYDALDRVIAQQFTAPGVSVAESWAYDVLGRLATDTNALDTFTYNYADATNRVSQITSTHGPAAATAYWTTAQRDGLLRILNYTYGATELAGYGYAMGPRHNVLQFVERVFDTLTTTTTYTNTYWYDAYGQLTQVEDTTSATSQVTDYGYDPAGNLTSSSVTNNPFVQGAPEVNTTYNSTNQIGSQQTTYAGEVGTYTVNGSYDAAGNLTTLALPPPATSSTFSCSYEAMNDPVDCTVRGNHSAFAYDGLERPIRVTHLSPGGTTLSDKTYLWCGERPCAAFDNTSGTPMVDKIYVNQGDVDFTLPGGAHNEYYIRDLLGSVRAVATNSASAPILAEYEYDAYGDQTVTVGDGGASDFGFTGMFTDSTTGLNFARHRVYSPALGRWLSRDPMGLGVAFQGGAASAFNGTNLNLYGYGANSPATNVDPSGFAYLHYDMSWVYDLRGELFGAMDMFQARAISESGAGNYGEAVFDQLVAASTALGGVVALALPTQPGDATSVLAPELGMAGVPELTAQGAVDVDTVLAGALKWLGDYNEIAPGVYRSTDGLRQFRMAPSDLAGTHGGGQHVHFEAFEWRNGEWERMENSKIPICP